MNDLSIMLAEAQLPGDREPPSRLLDALRDAHTGIAALSGQTDTEPFFTAVIAEFGRPPSNVLGQSAFTAERRARWVALIRWTFGELIDWTAEADTIGQRLAAVFIIMQTIRGGSHVWSNMPDAIARNTSLLNTLKSLVRSTVIEFAVRHGEREPIWEREAIERFKAADQAGNWAEIGNSLQTFEQQVFSQTFIFSQSIMLLARCGLDELVDATSGIKQTIVALQIAHILGRRISLSLATASGNAYVQFGCIYAATSKQGHGQLLTDEEQNDASILLSRIAVEQDRWGAWMKVFNTYPIRYPLLQEPLGRALATADEAAIRAYIGSIRLYPWSSEGDYGRGRRAVADCLRAFRATASLAKRQLLWSLAYDRWDAWDFAESDKDQHLFAINWSDLDFAIVAFACECIADNERQQQLNDIRHRMQNLDLRWFGSISEIWTAWNRLCSRFQPFAYATELGESGADWLCENRSYLPFDPATNLYIKAKYGMQ